MILALLAIGAILVWIFLIYRIQRAEKRLHGVSGHVYRTPHGRTFEPRYDRERLP